MTERFNRAISALVKGFFNETLAKGTCTACAVGNIVAEAQGGKITKKGKWSFDCTTENGFWGTVFATSNGVQENQIHYYRSMYNQVKDKDITTYKDNIGVFGYRSIIDTGYNAEELARVESVFEKNTKIPNYDYSPYNKDAVMKDQYNGLMACFEVLCDIEGVNKEEYQPFLAYNEDFTPVKELVLA